jgi:hypothetical protein
MQRHNTVKFETNISRKGIVRGKSQFPYSCVCERFIYSQDRSAHSAAGKYGDRFWEYTKIAHRNECGKIETDAAQFLFWEYMNGIFVAV